MDPLEIEYESLDNVPEAFRPLYSEQDGKAVLTGVNGMKTSADINNLRGALDKERNDHRQAKDTIKAWKALGDDPTEIQQKLDRMGELEAAAEGKIDENKIQEMVEQRLGQKTAPLERQLRESTQTVETLQNENNQLRSTIIGRDRNDAVRAVASEMKVLSTALPDVEMLAAHYLEQDETTGEFIVKADAKDVTPGADVKTFMKEMQKKRPHWWPASEGGGAGGGGAGGFGESNPWSAKSWSLTEQGRVLREKGQAEAERMAKAAGTTVGGLKPKK